MSNELYRPQHVVLKTRKGMEYFYLVSFAVVLVLAMLYIAGEQGNFYQLGYSITELRTENALLEEQRDRLQAELARVSSPERVIAESMRLGLRSLPPESYIAVRFGEPGQEMMNISAANLVAFNGMRP